MADRILTTHAGSLPRPEDLVDLNRARRDAALAGGADSDSGSGSGSGSGEAAYQERLSGAVAEVVARQREIGIDLVNDGEYGHLMPERYDYGAWWTYVFPRLGGLELVEVSALAMPQAKPREGQLALASFNERRDWQEFSSAYDDPSSGCALPNRIEIAPVCRAPITYTGQALVQQDIANMKMALAAAGVPESQGYLNSVAPGSCARIGNEHYADDEELVYACADAMREEYQAIIDSGLSLQLDDPAIAENWDQINPAPSVEAYRRFTQVRIDALNHAIRGLPAERIRFHLCWGSWHGPHTTDIPMAEIVDLMLQVDAGAYSFEAANVRHEHEWTVWGEVTLPPGKVILPGVVSHSTNVVEHPELVAQRLRRFAEGVGAENVVASTDCGLGGRVHPQVAWAKLQTLVEGAALVTTS